MPDVYKGKISVDGVMEHETKALERMSVNHMIYGHQHTNKQRYVCR